MRKTYLQIFITFIIIFLGVGNAYAYSLDEVSKHNTPDDCWMVFENKVYNITSDLEAHDGFMDIRSWCGKDMTEDFKTKDGLGRDHKPRSYNDLNRLYIGDLDISNGVVEKTNKEDSPIHIEEGEEEHYVEISGQELKVMSIQEIADAWEIDSEIFLTKIISKYNLQNSYTLNSTLDELKAEGGFSPSVIKTLADEIREGNEEYEQINLSQTSVSVDQNLPADRPQNPYRFSIPFFGTILLYFILQQLPNCKILKNSPWANKQMTKFYWNTLLVISLIPSALFGVLMIFQYSYPALRNIDFDFMWWHVEGSVVFTSAVLIHFVKRLKQYVLPLFTSDLIKNKNE